MLKVLAPFLTGLFLVLAATVLSIPQAGASSPKGIDVQEGEWSFTTLVDMSAFPGVPSRTIQFDDCLSRHHLVPLKAIKNCTTNPPSIVGNTLSYRMHCTSGFATGQFTYEKRVLSGLIVMTLNTPGNPRIEEHITGRYLAPCRKS